MHEFFMTVVQSKGNHFVVVLVLSTDREERLLRINALKDQFSISWSVSQKWLATTEKRLSLRSVYRRMRYFDLQLNWRPLILPLIGRHGRLRLQLCEECVLLDQIWNRIVNNESLFCLWVHNGRRTIRRRGGDKRKYLSRTWDSGYPRMV